MDVWNREQLYAEVWEQPLLKVAEKYRISDVMLGKICRKLKIPLPGRGYWARKKAGYSVKRIPLPKAKDLPDIPYYERPEKAESMQPVAPKPEPTDPQYLHVKDVESRNLNVGPVARRHKLVVATDKALRHSQVDDKGMVFGRWNPPTLDVRVSKNSLDRALNLLNSIIEILEAEGFHVQVKSAKHGTTTKIFGYDIPFSLVEKYHQSPRKLHEGNSEWSRNRLEYTSSGELEFRIGEDRWGGDRFRDNKRQRLEEMLPKLIGALMRNARDRVIRAEQERLAAIEQRKKDIEREDLRKRISDEEAKVAQLQGWVDSWVRAGKMREFIAALEKKWLEEGHNLSPETEKGERISWMKDQANRIDPMLPSPPSILDRKSELSH